MGVLLNEKCTTQNKPCNWGGFIFLHDERLCKPHNTILEQIKRLTTPIDYLTKGTTGPTKRFLVKMTS